MQSNTSLKTTTIKVPSIKLQKEVDEMDETKLSINSGGTKSSIKDMLDHLQSKHVIPFSKNLTKQPEIPVKSKPRKIKVINSLANSPRKSVLAETSISQKQDEIEAYSNKPQSR